VRSKKTSDGRLGLPARNPKLLALVPEFIATTDKRLIGFNTFAHLREGAFLQGKPDAVKHEPARLLRDAEGAAQLVRANAVLGVDDQPDWGEPLAQRKRAFAEDRSDLHRELFLARLAVAHHALAGKLSNLSRAAKLRMMGSFECFLQSSANIPRVNKLK
jgi:hypothetical protein